MEINKNDFLEAGVQFGHYKSQDNPSMKKFIFSTKNGISIIDLKKIMSHSLMVYQQVKEMVSLGSEILFVGKKKQAYEVIKNAAIDCASPFMAKKWPGGFLTNFSVISKEIFKLNRMIREIDSNEKISKKERVISEKKIEKLNDRYEGVLNLKKTPDAVFIFGLKSAEGNVVKEAKKLGIKIIAVCDTDTDSRYVDYVIPGNDDGVKSTIFFINLVSKAIKDGKSMIQHSDKEQENLVNDDGQFTAKNEEK